MRHLVEELFSPVAGRALEADPSLAAPRHLGGIAEARVAGPRGRRGNGTQRQTAPGGLPGAVSRACRDYGYGAGVAATGVASLVATGVALTRVVAPCRGVAVAVRSKRVRLPLVC